MFIAKQEATVDGQTILIGCASWLFRAAVPWEGNKLQLRSQDVYGVVHIFHFLVLLPRRRVTSVTYGANGEAVAITSDYCLSKPALR